jgi:DNA ligase-1
MGIELGIGETLLVKAIAESTGEQRLRSRRISGKKGIWARLLWYVAAIVCYVPAERCQMSRNTQPTMFKPKSLTVPGVFKDLTEIAKATGNAVRPIYTSITLGLN